MRERVILEITRIQKDAEMLEYAEDVTDKNNGGWTDYKQVIFLIGIFANFDNILNHALEYS